MTFWERVLAAAIGGLPGGILIYVMAYRDGKRAAARETMKGIPEEVKSSPDTTEKRESA